MFQVNQRVKVDLSNLTIQGVHFSENVREAIGTVLQQTSADPPRYLVKRVEVPAERIHAV